jgi:hypothetical protein
MGEYYVLMCLRQTGCDDVDWIYLAQDKHQWWAFLKTVLAFRFHKRHGILRPAERLLASQDRLSSMELDTEQNLRKQSVIMIKKLFIQLELSGLSMPLEHSRLICVESALLHVVCVLCCLTPQSKEEEKEIKCWRQYVGLE